jgi:hypothetical protein
MSKREFLIDMANLIILRLSKLTVMVFAAIGVAYYIPPYLTYLATHYSDPFMTVIYPIGLVLAIIGAFMFSFVWVKGFK